MPNSTILKYFVRIVILNYNESNYTLSIIEQLKKQSFQNFEIIVVDNDSIEKEKKILKDKLEKDIIAIYSSINLGYSAGNNLGIRYKENRNIDYFLILNNDLIIEDINFIKTLLLEMIVQKTNRVVASSPLIDTISVNTDLEKQIQVRRILPKYDFFLILIPIFNFFTKKKFQYFVYQKEMPYIGKNIYCDSINGAAFMIDKEFIKKINYLDEGTFLYHEEIILGKQILNDGKTCILNGNISVKHLQGLSTKSAGKKINVKMERIKYKSALYYLTKYENLGKLESYLFIFLSEISIFIKKIIR